MNIIEKDWLINHWRKKQNAYYKQYYLKNKEKILMNRGKIYGKRYIGEAGKK